MTFRGTVINGVVVPDPGPPLPEGARVSMSRLSGSRRSAKPSKPLGLTKGKPRRSPVKAGKVHPLIALAGIWKDRPDWKGKSSIEIVAELRRRPTGRARG